MRELWLGARNHSQTGEDPMKKWMMVVASMMVMAFAVSNAHAAKKVRAPKQHKPTMEELIRKAVSEAIQDNKPALHGKYEYQAKRMRPPKNAKWTKRWNELGQEGWQLVGSIENIYVFQRPGSVDLGADPKAQKQAKKAAEKAQKEKDKAALKGNKEADKTDLKLNKEADKTLLKSTKQADKAALKAQKEADKAAQKAAKEAAKAAKPK